MREAFAVESHPISVVEHRDALEGLPELPGVVKTGISIKGVPKNARGKHMCVTAGTTRGAARMPIISAVDPIRAVMGRRRDGNHEVAR